MTQEDIIKKIEPSISSLIVSIAKEILSIQGDKDAIVSSLEIEKKKLQDILDESASTIKKVNELSKIQRESEQTILRATERSEELSQMEKRVYDEIKSLDDVRESLKESIAVLQSEQDKLSAVVNERNDIKLEIEQLRKEVNRIEKDIAAKNKEYISITDSIASDRFQFDRMVLKKEEELEKKQKELQERLTDAKELQLKLSVKEKDLATIESRWFKLFGEKGLSFRV